jgi:hypothetical protein
MKLGELKSLGHNVADSLASGIGMMIGVYDLNVFGEAHAEDEGFIVVDFLAGEVKNSKVSDSLRRAVRLYRQELPSLCGRHRIDIARISTLQARFGTDKVYGPHFTVTVRNDEGRESTDRYVGSPGKRLRHRA